MKRYTPYEKKRILRHARIHGVTAASVRFGAGKSSIHLWQKREMAESPPTPVVAEKRVRRKKDKPELLSHFDADYSKRVQAAFERGAREYGLEHGKAATLKSLQELRQELADICGWACKVDYQVAGMVQRLEEVECD